MNPIYQFFCWAGGGNISVLRQLPTEQNRFFGYGTVIMMTAIFATLSSLYAFSFLLSGQFGSFVFIPAFAWGFFIFVLDRFFITTISSSGGFIRRFFTALPRLILAVFIGVLISKPLEFRIFEREINEQLSDLKIEEYELADTLYREQIAKLKNDEDLEISKMAGGQEIGPLLEKINEYKQQLPALEKAVKEQEEKVNCECNGACGTMVPGDGPACGFEKGVYARKLGEKNKVEAAIKNAEDKIENIRSKLQSTIEETISPKFKVEADSIAAQREKRKKLLDDSFQPSILNQQIALAKIQDDPDKPTAFYAVWFITILFIFIEMAPMLLKLMSKNGAYEDRLSQIEGTYRTDGRLRRSIDLEEYKSNRELVKKLAKRQKDLIGKELDKWYQEELEKVNDPAIRSRVGNNEN